MIRQNIENKIKYFLEEKNIDYEINSEFSKISYELATKIFLIINGPKYDNKKYETDNILFLGIPERMGISFKDEEEPYTVILLKDIKKIEFSLK